LTLFAKLRGIVGDLFQLGLNGPNLKNSTGAIEARDAADGAYAVVRAATPADNSDASIKLYADLGSDPSAPGLTYTNTHTDQLLIQELWTRTVLATLLKQVDYTYTDGLLTTEVRSIYAVNGITVDAQLTITSTYTSGVLTGQITVRNV